MAVTPVSAAAAASAASETTKTTTSATIAQNFQTFLQLLTTQLKNQNPLEPLDTNQFTQQLVQFAQVEQQINMNSSLSTLISLQQASQTSAALGFLGQNVTISGDTAKLANGQASWSFSSSTPATATITITNSAGQTAYSGTYAVNAGTQNFAWDGRGGDGTLWPDGAYKMSVAAKDANGQAVAISTEVTGVVDAVDLKQNPPVLSIGNQSFTADQIKQVRRAGA
jgi:flagellar basal-body rod modification protein FlgD